MKRQMRAWSDYMCDHVWNPCILCGFDNGGRPPRPHSVERRRVKRGYMQCEAVLDYRVLTTSPWCEKLLDPRPTNSMTVEPCEHCGRLSQTIDWMGLLDVCVSQRLKVEKQASEREAELLAEIEWLRGERERYRSAIIDTIVPPAPPRSGTPVDRGEGGDDG